MIDDDDSLMTNLVAHSLEGNALGVKDVVDTLLSGKALQAIQGMKIDVASSVYGSHNAIDENGPEDPEESDDWEIPEDDDGLMNDQDIEDLFNELDDLTDQEETETDEDESDV